MIASVFVPGEPRAQGSKRGIVRNGRAVLVESAKGLGQWRAAIGHAAGQQDCFVDQDPVGIQLTFTLPRPKSARARSLTYAAAAKKPDLDKLIRAVLDALTGVWLRDDSQVVLVLASKQVAKPEERPGVLIELLKAPA